MSRPMTAEQVLKAIYEAHADAFSDSRRLYALFSDYSRGQLRAQQNQLDIFLKCDGNTCILNLRNAPKQKQQTEYHRLIQEMVSNYGMQEEVALKVSGAFWRVVIRTEPPVSVDKPALNGLNVGVKMGYTDPRGKSGGQAAIPASGTSWVNNVLMRDNAGQINANEIGKCDSEAVAAAEKKTVLGSEIRRSQIQSVTFMDTLAAAPAASWDVSEARNRSVLAWVRKKENLYDLFIAGEGGVNGQFCDGLFAYYTSLREIHFNGNFHTDQAASCRGMFYYCICMTKLDVTGFDTSKVTDLCCMFAGCIKLEVLDVSGFKTSKVTDMRHMFYWCESLKALNVSGFDTSKVTDMGGMFYWCTGLKALDVRGFDTSRVIDMYRMFWNCERVEALDVSKFDTSKVTNMSGMFYYCASMTELDVTGFDTSKVTDMRWMFQGCQRLKALNLSGFDTSRVIDMDRMFCSCQSLKTLDVSGFDTSKVTDMGEMFGRCEHLVALDVSGFDTSKVTNMSGMFWNCERMEALDVSKFDTSRVTDMSMMFADCESLESLNISGFDTSNVRNMRAMFRYCNHLGALDVSGFDTSEVTDMRRMFHGVSSQVRLKLGVFDTSKVVLYEAFMDSGRLVNGRPWEELFRLRSPGGNAYVFPSI